MPPDNPPTGDLEFHPTAELFPLLGPHDLRRLRADIVANGQLEPIVLFEKKILDGRNRYLACNAEGITPRTEELKEGDPLKFVLSRNLHRRHLNDAQRCMIAARIACLPVGANQHDHGGVPNGTAAAMLNVSQRSVARAKNVLKEGTPDVVRAVAGGELPIAVAEQIVRLPKSNQQGALQRRLERKKSKKSNKTPALAQHDDTPEVPAGQPAADCPDNSAVVASLVDFANFILPRVSDQGDIIVITITTEDAITFNALADRVRSTLNVSRRNTA